MRPSETVHMEDGKLIFNRRQNVDSIIEGVAERSQLINKTKRSANGALYLGSIDSITGENWARECGAGVGTAEFNAYAHKQLLSGNYAKYRADIS